MAKFWARFAFFAILAVAVAEPPPPSSYLPPQARNGALSPVYGAPGGSGNGGRAVSTSFHSQRTGTQSFSYESEHAATQSRSSGHGTFGAAAGRFGQVSQQYGAPSQGFAAAGQSFSAPSSAYAAPAASGNGFSSRSQQSFSAASQSFSAPSQTYGAPSAAGNGFAAGFSGRSQQSFSAPSQTYGAPAASGRSQQSFSAVGQSFSAPAQTYGAPSASGNGFAAGFSGRSQQSFSAPSQTYGTPSASGNGFAAGNGFSAPSQSYGAPTASGNGFFASAGRQSFAAASNGFSGQGFNGAPSAQYGPPSTQYGVPSARKLMEDDLAEPANYEYNYQVLAAQDSGAEFGHQESRENEAAKGQYHVLLPDGRMQIVEYEADEEGFRPNIRYEETGGYPAARGNGLEGPY